MLYVALDPSCFSADIVRLLLEHGADPFYKHEEWSCRSSSSTRYQSLPPQWSFSSRWSSVGPDPGCSPFLLCGCFLTPLCGISHAGSPLL